MGLHNITTVNTLWIGYHFSTQLTSLSGLEGLTTINGNLTIGYNDGLTTLTGLDNLQTIGGALWITQLPTITSLSTFNNLTSVGEYISISGVLLMNSSAFQNLTSALSFRIGTSGLTSITELNNLQNISALHITNNSNLTNISSLNNLNPNNLTDLNITNNPLLTLCNLPNFCTYLANDPITSPRSIHSNAGDCLDEATVILACQDLNIERPEITCDFMAYTNNNVLNIISNNFVMKHVEIYDLLGRIVYSNTVNTNLQQINDLVENQSLFIKVTTTDGKLYFKKIMN